MEGCAWRAEFEAKWWGNGTHTQGSHCSLSPYPSLITRSCTVSQNCGHDTSPGLLPVSDAVLAMAVDILPLGIEFESFARKTLSQGMPWLHWLVLKPHFLKLVTYFDTLHLLLFFQPAWCPIWLAIKQQFLVKMGIAEKKWTEQCPCFQFITCLPFL